MNFSCVYLLLIGLTLSAVVHAEPSKALLSNGSATSRIIQSTPYQIPFKSYQVFIDFMKKSKFAKPAWSDTRLKSAFPETLFDQCHSLNKIQFNEVLYTSDTGVTRGWTIRPLNNKANLPVVVYNRGGFAKWGRIVPFELLSLCRVAAQGYMVIASDFRGLSKNNNNQNESAKLKQNRTDLGCGDVKDSFNLIDAISKKHSDIDIQNIAVWGFSRGTTISMMMATESDNIRLIILHGMLTDAVNDARRQEFDQHVYPLLVENYQTLSQAEKDALLAGISPKFLLSKVKGKPSFTIFHGALDERTSAAKALGFASELLNKNYAVEFHLFPRSGHGLTGDYNEYIEKTINALNYQFKKENSER